MGKALLITVRDLSGNARFAQLLFKQKAVEVSQQSGLTLIIGAGEAAQMDEVLDLTGQSSCEAFLGSWGHLLRPFQGHLLQGVKIDLGIDEGGAEMAMAEHVGNCLQRMTLMEHAGGKAMPKGMCALAGELDARSPDDDAPR